MIIKSRKKMPPIKIHPLIRNINNTSNDQIDDERVYLRSIKRVDLTFQSSNGIK